MLAILKFTYLVRDVQNAHVRMSISGVQINNTLLFSVAAIFHRMRISLQNLNCDTEKILVWEG